MKQEEPEVPQEEEKEEVVEEEPEKVEEVAPEPEVDIEAIKKEGFDEGYAQGRDAGYEEGKQDGYESGIANGISQAKQDFVAIEPETSVEDIKRATKYFSLINIFGYWVDSYMPLNPPFKRTDHFTEEECLLIKQMYILNCSVQPPINFSQVAKNIQNRVFNLVNRIDEPINDPATAAVWNQGNSNPAEPITYKNLAESFDRVLESSLFTETTYNYITASGEMIGMGMYGGMPNIMPGQMFGQFPQMVPAMQQPDVQTNIPQQIQPNIGSYNQVPTQNMTQKIEQVVEPTTSVPDEKQAEEPVQETTIPYQSIPVEETTEQPPTEVVVQKEVADQAHAKHITDAWNDDGEDEEDDEYDDGDSDNEEDEKKTEEDDKEEITQEQDKEKEVIQQEDEKKGFYEDRSYNRGRYNARGYPQRAQRAHRGGYVNNYRGGRGNYNKNYHNQDYEHKYRGGRRGGNSYRHDRGGRGRENYYHKNQYYEEEQHQQHEKPVEKIDDDGFNVVTEKVYTKKKFKQRGGAYRGRPKASDN